MRRAPYRVIARSQDTILWSNVHGRCRSPVLRDVSLDDKYALESGRVYLTGAQAFVRLLILQRQRDALAGLNTAGFVSGYRGSPLGALDQSLWKAAEVPRARAHQVPARA